MAWGACGRKWYSEVLEGSYGRFHGHDRLFMLAAQLKHSALWKLFLVSLESHGLPRNPPDGIMVSKDLRHMGTEWRFDETELENLDSQYVCRVFGYVALRRCGIAEMNPEARFIWARHTQII